MSKKVDPRSVSLILSKAIVLYLAVGSRTMCEIQRNLTETRRTT